ncbi:hypothetical protein HpBT138_03180 [Helicobacter pylori]
MPENDECKHNPKYCELEHLLEKMAKESENKAFYKVFCESYEEFFSKIKQIKPIQSEQKNAPNTGYNPISRFLFV